MFLIRVLKEAGFSPQRWLKIAVGGSQGIEACLSEVTKSTGMPGSTGVAIRYTSHTEKLLADRRRNKTSTTGCGDHANLDRSALTGNLHGDSVGKSHFLSPVSTADWDDSELRKGDSTTNGSSNLLSTLYTQTNMSIMVTNSNKGFESGPLSGSSLLLHRHDLQNFVLQGILQEMLNDGSLLDGHGKQVNLFQRVDLSLLD